MDVGLPKTMKAAILTAQHEPLVVDEVSLPDRLSHGQVLVRIHFSGICGSQLGEIDGVKGEDRFLPHLLGHEGSGRVVEVGPGVKTVQPGDSVVLHWRKGAGIEAELPAYRWRGRTLNAGWVTTFNESAVVSENRVTALPPDFDLRLAPLLGCAASTGLGVVENDARLKMGESIVVFGAGGVGLSVIQGAAMVSAHPIVAVDLFDAKLKLAAELGATHVLNAKTCDVRSVVLRLAGESGADVVVDNTGRADVIELAYDLTQPNGRTILVGVPRKGERIAIDSLPLHFGKVLIGSHGGAARPEEDVPRWVKLWRAGKLTLEPLVTDLCTLNGVNEAIGAVRRGAVAGRCLIDMSPNPADGKDGT